MKFSFFLSVATLAPFAFADEPAFIDDVSYAQGKLGAYPVSTYLTTDFVSPRVNKISTSSRCNQGLYTMLTPRGHAVEHPGPIILDDDGNLVWTKNMEGYGQSYGLTVQKYKGQDFLTFWAGDDGVGGHGAGYYYMLDSTYKEVYKIAGAGGKDADLHEMTITADGTALITVYDVHSVDLTSLGHSKTGWVWDCLIQEIDIETSELVFEWRVSEHVDFTDGYRNIGGEGDIPSRPFDYFHMNSIEKDPLGNYLISSRYFHTITYIDGKTKEIIWTFGGKHSDFVDLSDGQATNFGWQHHARWHDNYTTITLFDNGAQNGQRTEPYSKGMHIKLDLTANPMTAELIQEYVDTDKISTESQGSIQILENGNVLLGYGHNALWAEFSSDGTVLCQTYYESQSHMNTGDVQSYRVFKNKWVGRPLENPVVKIMEEEVGGGLVVSWMGATEVKFWSIELSPDAEADKYTEISRTKKTGFETSLDLGRVSGYLRVVGLDKEGRVLGWSDVIDLSVERTWATSKLRLVGEGAVPFVLFIGMVAFVGIFLISYEIIQCRRRLRENKQMEKDGESEEAQGFLNHESNSTDSSPRQPIPKIFVERNWDEFNRS